MEAKQKNPVKWQNYLTIVGLAAIILLALIIPASGLFKAKLTQEPVSNGTTGTCQSIKIVSLPDAPLPAGTSAIISVKVQPENFTGSFSYSAGSGILNDLSGNIGSFINTSEKTVSYSGGDPDSSITIQARGTGNENCVATIPVVPGNEIACSSLRVESNPSPIPPDQSAELTIIPNPETFTGTFLIQAESGKFQIENADTASTGTDTKTLVTKSRLVLYNGGKAGEKIVTRALGAANSNCIATIVISK